MNSATVSVYPEKLRMHFVKKSAVLFANLIRFRFSAHSYATLIMGLPLRIRQSIWDNAMKKWACLPLPMANWAEQALEELKENGIVKIDRDFSAMADYINQTYVKNENQLPANSPLRKNGLIMRYELPFTDTHLSEVLFDPDLCALMCNYYGAQAFYRNNCMVYKNVTTESSVPLVSGVFHSDGFHQITFMLLLEDVPITSTHMEYAVGSHKDLQPTYDRKEIDQSQIEKHFKIEHVIGKKGTLFIFDSEGLHRGAYKKNSTRSMLHANITPAGIYRFASKQYPSLDVPDKAPPYVSNFVSMAIKRAA